MADENDLQIARLAVEKGYCSESQAEEARDIVAKLAGMGLSEDLGAILVKKKYLSADQLEDLRRSLASRQPVNIGGFEIIGRLGRGAMGAVYKARQVSMDRVVALKVLPPNLARDQSYVGRFFHEARAIAQLNHPNIIQGIDVGVSGKYYYFAMEFVDGRTVRDILRERGRLDERGALGIIEQTAAALEHAHRNGLVHRDIKPENIMITTDGVAKLCDLGLAKTTREGASRTQSGLAVGTPHYISPEQARGEADVDIRADLYSLGATLFHMLTGKTPYEGTTAAVVMTKHLSEGVPDVRRFRPEVSEATAAVLRKLMAKEREDRYQTPSELLEDLRRVREGGAPVYAAAPRAARVRPTVRHAPPRRSVRRGAGAAEAGPSRRTLVLAGLIAGGGLLAIGLVVAMVGLGGGSGDGETLPDPGPRTGGPATSPGPEPGLEPGPRVHPDVAAAAELLAKAEDYEKRNPKAYNLVLFAYREARDRYPEAPAAREAAKAMKRVDAAHRDAALRAVDGLDARAGPLRKGDRFAEAMRVYDEIPAGLMRKEAMDRINAARDHLRSQGEARWRQVKREAESLVEKGGHEEAARRAAEMADRIGLESVVIEKEGFLRRLKGLEQKRLAALRDASEKRAQAAWEKLRDAAYAAARNETRLAAEAGRCRRELKENAELAPRKGLVEDLAADLERAAAVYELARTRCERAAGGREHLSFTERSGRAHRGRVIGCTPEGEVRYEIGPGASTTFQVRNLSTECLASLAGVQEGRPAGAYVRGLAAFFREEITSATAGFKAAAADAEYRPRAERYLALLEPKIKAAREREAADLLRQARELYARAQRSGSKADWEQLRALLDRIEEYKDTETYQRAQ